MPEDNPNPLSLRAPAHLSDKPEATGALDAADRYLRLLDALNAVVYVADMETCEILFANKGMREDFGDVLGKRCWRVLQKDQTGPCPFCASDRLVGPDGRPAPPQTREYLNSAIGRWRLIQDQAVRWEDGRLARLTIAWDITERKRAERMMTALHDLSNALWASSDLEAYLERVHDIFRTAIGAENFFVALADPENDRVVFPYFADERDGNFFEIKGLKPPAAPTPTLHVLRTGRTAFFTEDELARKVASGEFRLKGTLSRVWLGAPLIEENQTIGVLAVQDYRDPRRFTATDGELLASAASLVAVAIQRKRAEQALRDSEERHRALSRAALEAVFITDQGRCLDANQAAENLFGYGRREMLGMRGTDFIAPPYRELVARNMLSDFKETYEAAGLRKDGSTFPCEIRGRMFDHKGANVRVTVLRDIAERRRGEAALRESENRFRSIVRNLPIGLHLYELNPDDSLVLLETNPAADLHSKWDNAPLIGKPVEEVLAGVAGTEYPGILREAARRGRPWSARGFHYKDANIEGFFDVWVFQTSPNRMAMLFLDASARQEAEKALIEAKEAAERATRSRSEFLANMSHELRTPLNGVFGMLRLAGETDLTPEQRAYVDIALSTGKSLLAVINDILDFSKMDAGALSIAREAFDPRDVLTSVAEHFRAPAEDKKVVLRVLAEPDVPRRLLGDEGRLRQILFNLTGNALKFTESGQVSVQVCLLPPRRPGVQVLLFVASDTGIGIPDDRIQDVFGAFSQVDGAYNRRFKGAGLGLSIVKKLVELMDGTMTVESEVGKGTSFYVALPFGVADEERQSPPASRPATAVPVRPLRILVAEDERVNQIALSLSLEKRGHEAVCAENGRQVLEKMRDQVFDLILMDIQMPGMDGIQATRAIRESEDSALDRDVPIIALTAHAMKGDREKFLDAGMDEYLSKPLEFADLERLLSLLPEMRENNRRRKASLA